MISKIVIAVHGIMTRGAWQKSITPLLSSKGWTVYPLDYGRFGFVPFCCSWKRKAKIEWFLDEYTKIFRQHDTEPSVVAHSFGTYIVASALEKYEAIKLDKVIFCGSIVDPNYNWLTILNNQQVRKIRNDYGRLDTWARLANIVVSDAGPSGSEGFKIEDPRVINKEFKKFSHSDYFKDLHFLTYWIPFLEEEVLDLKAGLERDRDKVTLVTTLERIASYASHVLSMDQRFLRANIFVPMEAKSILRIPEGVHWNMKDLDELTISIEPGFGCTGNAFQNGEPTIAILEEGWGKYSLDETELKKVHKDLVWIFSQPVLDPENEKNVIAVINVDCLEQRRAKGDIEKIGSDMVYWAILIAPLIKRIYGGA